MTIETPGETTEPTLLATWDYGPDCLLTMMQTESMRGDAVRPPRAVVRLSDPCSGRILGQTEVLLPSPTTLGGMHRIAVLAAADLIDDEPAGVTG